MQIKFNTRDPVYLQVVRRFKEQVASGQLDPGEEISSRRELAGQLKINPNTAQRAYKEMEAEGLIYTDGNSPSKVTRDAAILQKVKEELITQAVESFVQSIHSIHVPLDDVLDIVKEMYEKKGIKGGANDD